MNPDPIKSVLDSYYRGISVPATRPDATAVASRTFTPPTSQNVMRAASPTPAAQPQGGLFGALLSAGNQVDNFVRERMQSYPADKMKSDARALAPFVIGGLLGGGTGLGLVRAATAAEADAAPVAAAAAELSPDQALYAQMMQRVADPRLDAVRNRAASTLFDILQNERISAEATPGQLANLGGTGFANLGPGGSNVLLPASGAGRGGSTATAIARAKKIVGPETLKRMAQDELARRGGTSPEASMASLEQIARAIASRP